MPSVKGKQITCDRCGESIFLKFLSCETSDGGYGYTYDKYEDEPKGWLYETQFGYLCPKCALEFKTFVTKFMKGKVAMAWKVDVEEETND